MIKIEVADAALIETIRDTKRRWFATAKLKAAAARLTGKVDGKRGYWSKLKDVFVRFQGPKCIYCEFPMPEAEPGSMEKVAVAYDVDHYRPKNRVTIWPTPEALAARPWIQDYQAQVLTGSPAGYPRLAYDPFNFVLSCKPCNTSYKSDHFPIAGLPQSRGTKRRTLDARERPLLLFPFGAQGDDPGRFLSFCGPAIYPLPAEGYERLRAQVVIDFFELDTREDLFAGRCTTIQSVWLRLERRNSTDPQKRASAEAFLKAIETGHHYPHTACGRAFIRLYSHDRGLAEELFEAAVAYLDSKDPAISKALCSLE